MGVWLRIAIAFHLLDLRECHEKRAVSYQFIDRLCADAVDGEEEDLDEQYDCEY